jgi:hypothetical protein
MEPYRVRADSDIGLRDRRTRFGQSSDQMPAAAASIQNDSGPSIGLGGHTCGRLSVRQTDRARAITCRWSSRRREGKHDVRYKTARFHCPSRRHSGRVRIEYRWGAGDADRFRRYATELVALAPDVILASSAPTVAALQQATRTVPVVFVLVVDPVGSGFVESLARPGGNITGFMLFEYGISGKWLELLKEIAPRVTRAAVLRDPTLASGGGQLGAIQSVAPSFGMELSPVGVRDAGEIERAITAFARGSNGGLIVTAGALAVFHRELIIALAARHRLPAIYNSRLFSAAGGLMPD